MTLVDEKTRAWHAAHLTDAGFYALRHPDRAFFLRQMRKPVLATIAALSAQQGHPLNILEVGCGSGADGVCLALQGHDVTIIDPSEYLLAEARNLAARAAALFPDAPLALRPMQGDVFNLQAYAGQYEVVLSFGLTVIWRDERKRLQALASMRAALRPGGRLVLGTTNTLNPLFKLIPVIPLVADLADHNLAILEAEVRQAGFAVVDRGTAGLSEHFAQWLAAPWAYFPLRVANTAFECLPSRWRFPVAPHVFVVAKPQPGSSSGTADAT